VYAHENVIAFYRYALLFMWVIYHGLER